MNCNTTHYRANSSSVPGDPTEFIANECRAVALAQDCDRLVGRYVATAKNRLVAGLYERLGFTQAEETATTATWTLDLDQAACGWKTWVRAAPAAGEVLHA